MFTLRVFGGLSLESNTAPVPPRALQRRRLALLASLALSGTRGLSRERVETYLWPDSPADRARHALDQLLYATRRDLGGDAILSSAGELRINPAVVRADNWAFDDAIRDERWSEAAELYRGPLMDGVHLIDSTDFEQWVDAERTRVEQEYRHALTALAQAAAARGDHTEAARWWRRCAGADPLSAPVALGLMRALVAAGDRTGAIQHGRVYQQFVRTTLELEPDPAVGELESTLAASGTAGTDEAARSPLPVEATAHTVARASETPPPSAPEPVTPAPPPRASPPDVPRTRQSRSRSRTRIMTASALVAGLAIVTAALVFSDRSHAAAPDTAAELPSPTPADSGMQPLGGIAPSAAPHVADPETRMLALHARDLWNTRTKRGLEDAVVLYRRATERDPLYADAYVGLAESYTMLGYFGFEQPDAMFPKAEAAAHRALELDPGAGEAYAPLGQVLAWKNEWAESERAYRRGLELTPGSATLHQWYGLMLAYMGRAHEAAVQAGDASRLDPLSVQINNMYGMMLYYDGNLSGALRQYEHTVTDEPDSAWVRQNPWVLSNFSRVAAAAGHHAQAIHLLDLALRVVPHDPRVLLEMAHADVVVGDSASARAVFARADTTHAYYRVYRAELHALLGEMDSAYAVLNSTNGLSMPALVGLNNDPSYAAFRADLRYAILRKRLGMPPR